MLEVGIEVIEPGIQMPFEQLLLACPAHEIQSKLPVFKDFLKEFGLENWTRQMFVSIEYVKLEEPVVELLSPKEMAAEPLV